MDFQGDQYKKKKRKKIPGRHGKFDWKPGGQLQRNRYPQQGGMGTIFFLEKPNTYTKAPWENNLGISNKSLVAITTIPNCYGICYGEFGYGICFQKRCFI